MTEYSMKKTIAYHMEQMIEDLIVDGYDEAEAKEIACSEIRESVNYFLEDFQ